MNELPEPLSLSIWTDKQVEYIKEWNRRFHPYTCSGGGGGCSEVTLVPETTGLHCPSCGRVQTWAHDFILDGSFLPAADEAARQLRERISGGGER